MVLDSADTRKKASVGNLLFMETVCPNLQLAEVGVGKPFCYKGARKSGNFSKTQTKGETEAQAEELNSVLCSIGMEFYT